MKIILSVSTGLVAAANYPTPEVQTVAQKASFEAHTALAKSASEAATPEVLRFFDSQDFRSAIQECCPEAAAMPSADLLSRLRQENQVAELAHAFPHTAGESHFTDFTLDTALNYDWFINECQAKIIAGQGCRPDQAETGPFGCPAIAGQTATWDEASSQLIYVAHNIRQSDFGSAPNFGDVTAIFNRAYVKDMVLIAPMDTGLYERNCNRTSDSLDAPQPGKANCSAWSPQHGVVGTLDYHDHLILSNLYYFAGSGQQSRSVYDNARLLFERSALAGDYTKLSPLDQQEVMHYWESDILGNPRLSGGVKFLIGNFKNLFGTAAGKQLQTVADHYSWPLFWAHGTVSGGSRRRRKTTADASVHGSERVLDPVYAHTNASIPSDAQTMLEDLWSQVEAARAGTIQDSQLDAFWSTFQDQQLRVAPLTALACADADSCFATDVSTGDCICHSQDTIVV